MKNIFSKNAEILSTALMAQSPKNKKVLAGSFEFLYCLGHITLVLSKAVKRQYELDRYSIPYSLLLQVWSYLKFTGTWHLLSNFA